MKRFISVIMCVIMLATVIPFTIFAEEDGNPTAGQSSAGAEQTAVLKGGSSVTNALLSASDTNGQQGEYFASIAGAELDGKTVNVRFDSTVAGSVVAAIYSDDGLTMLASANAEFEGSDEAQFFKLVLDIDSVPEYYILKVFLLGEDHKALCGNFTDIEHTSTFADFMAKDVDDFEPELVVNMDDDNSNNFAVVKEGAVTPEHSGTVNTVITNDFENGRYVIGNATDDIKSLKAGDLLNLKYGDSDLDVIVAVVSSVSVKGDTVTITENKEAGLADYFDYVKIDVDTSAPAYTMNTDDLPEGIEYNGLYYGSPYDSFEDENALQPANQLNKKVGVKLVDEKGSYSPNFTNKFTLQLLSAAATVKNGNGSISGTGSATAEIDFSVTSVEYKLYFDAKLWKKDTVVCNLILTSEIKFIIKGEITGKLELSDIVKDALKIEVPVFAGLYVVGGFYPVVSLEIKGSFSIITAIKKSSGFRYNNRDGLEVVKTEEKENKLESKVQVVIKIGFGVNLGLKVGAPVIDNLSVTASVFIEGGLKFSGEADKTAGSDTHPCNVCLKGTADVFLIVGVECKLKLTEHIALGRKIAAELDFPQGKAHISLYQMKFSFGLGTCLNIKYRIGITVVDENNKAVSGAEIKYIDEEDLKTAKTDPEGKADIYLPVGSHIIDADTDGASGSKTVKVKEKEQDIIIKIRKKLNLTVDVKDENGQYVPGAYVDISGKKITVGMETSDNGSAEVVLEPGEYTVTAEKGGYTGSETVTLNESKMVTITIKKKDSSDDAPAGYSTGTLVTFGSYPQSEVKDEATKTALNSLLPEWDSLTSYGYYSGDGHDGSGEPSDYMKYADVNYNGVKYRAVRFTSYRPYWTQGICSADNSYQDEYGYHTDIVYWFKYEPVVWRVLDPAKGLLMTESIIDSQAFENDYYDNDDYNDYVYGDEDHDVYGDEDHTHYASDWAYSSLRDWLNGCFLDTAFMNDAEKKCIKPTDLTTPSSDGTVYNAGDTKDDKVFLLSRDDALNESYGFSSSEDSDEDTNRVAFGTDYAKCQGLWEGIVYYGEASSYWRVRTPIDSNETVDVADTGYFSIDNTGHACGGVRAALRVDLQSAISKGIIKIVNGKVSSPLKKSILTAAAETPAGPDAEKSKIGTLKYNLGAAKQKTVSHSKCIPGNEYVFICVKDSDSDLFVDGNLLYIDQKTAENGIIEFTYKVNAGTELFFGIFADFTLGDVDGDGQVLAKDARLALRASASLETLEGIAFLAADVDGNGKILANDARQILRFSAQLIKEFEKADK